MLKIITALSLIPLTSTMPLADGGELDKVLAEQYGISNVTIHNPEKIQEIILPRQKHGLLDEDLVIILIAGVVEE